ncbi:HlyC/CorC family transporter [bacterium]|nr:MAG: HlyC/CorC family transporter [bacterium]
MSGISTDAEIAGLVALVLLAMFFAATEAALVSISRIKARAMIESRLHGAHSVLRLIEDRNRFLTTVLIGNTIVLLAADSLATYLFIQLGVPRAAIWSTVLMTFLLLTFGEIIPKTIAVGNAEKWARRLAPWLERVAFILSPLNAGFLWLTNGILRAFGGSPSAHGPFVTEDDIRALVNVGAEQNVLEEQEREMIHSVIEFGDTIVREVMTPRPDIVAVERAMLATRALDLVIKEGYSKIPVYQGTIDEIVGVVHERELLVALANGTLAHVALASLMRAVELVPENKRVSEMLREMRRGKYSLAVVVDEYGGTAGLVTLEDLLEEIVGEIRGERDELEEEPIRRISPHEAVVEASTNVEDVNAELSTDLPTDEFETIGGLTVGLFGRLPAIGEEVVADEHVRLKVERTRGRRILAVRVLHDDRHEVEDGYRP